VRKRFVFVVAIGLAVVGLVLADDNVREVQQKLRGGGFYTGEPDGAYSSQLSVALTRYQIRNGLPITGQLDAETSKALGAKPAVATTENDRAKSSETWRTLRMGGQHTAGTPGSDTEIPPRSAPAATRPISLDSTEPASALPATGSSPAFSTERLRDYVGAFVLAGLDPQVGSETDFFADSVQYYDQGMMTREKIRNDLQRYAARWPERQFWLDGDITVEPQNGNRVLVTFPLRYDLRNGAKHSSGKVNKTLVLEPAGDDLQIVAVNERKAG
jgi:peptidoglycan hydrolase-like protein with peptidoglycan-binding domain